MRLCWEGVGRDGGLKKDCQDRSNAISSSLGWPGLGSAYCRYATQDLCRYSLIKGAVACRMRKPGLLSGEERIMAVGGSKGPSWLISSIVKAARSIFSNPETPLAKLCIMLCTLTIEIIGGIALCVIGAVIPR